VVDLRDPDASAILKHNMHETPHQYPQRMLGYVDGKEPLARQATNWNS
jgi:hypothetical protein